MSARTDASEDLPIVVDERGDGPRAVLVHGSVLAGPDGWPLQLPLAERWHLVIPYRRGHHPNPVIPGPELSVDVDADDIAQLLGDGAHLAGQSIGALIALIAAARRPDAVRSLVVNEPPLFGLVPEHPGAIAQRQRIQALLSDPPASPAALLEQFELAVGSPPQGLVDPLPDDLAQNVALLIGGAGANRPIPDDAFAVLRERTFPKVVVSGGHSDAQEAAADVLAERIGAERAVVEGKGHRIPRVGDPYNALLEQTWLAGEALAATHGTVPAPEEAHP